MTTIHLETTIQATLEQCFTLSLSVDVHMGSMSNTGERAVAGVTSGTMKLGDTVTWEARHLGVNRRLTSRITEFDPPFRFVDEQVTGPFTRFRHVHTFEPYLAGTLMIDDFGYDVPFGLIGKIGDRLILAWYMKRLLSQRNAYLKHAAESAKFST